MNASVITTYRCNAKCHMCNIWKFPTDIEEELTPDIIAKLPGGLGRINLTGGEPTLREDIDELVGILYKKCQKVEISTNGYYTDTLVRLAEKYPVIMIGVSL
ncbi:MAG: radical SAM protein [candidate division Zixibacteria bacterium]